MFNKYHTKETRMKISKNHIDVSGQNNPMYGKKGNGSQKGRKLSEQCKKNMSIARLGKKRGPYKKKVK